MLPTGPVPELADPLDDGAGLLLALFDEPLHAATRLTATATQAKAATRDRDMDLAGRMDSGVGLPSTGRIACKDRARCPRR